MMSQDEERVTLDQAREFALQAQARGDTWLYLSFPVYRSNPWRIWIRIWGCLGRVIKRDYDGDRVVRIYVKFQTLDVLNAWRRRRIRMERELAKPLRVNRPRRLPKSVMIR
jgi:hypothetical protein